MGSLKSPTGPTQEERIPRRDTEWNSFLRTRALKEKADENDPIEGSSIVLCYSGPGASLRWPELGRHVAGERRRRRRAGRATADVGASVTSPSSSRFASRRASAIMRSERRRGRARARRDSPPLRAKCTVEDPPTSLEDLLARSLRIHGGLLAPRRALARSRGSTVPPLRALALHRALTPSTHSLTSPFSLPRARSLASPCKERQGKGNQALWLPILASPFLCSSSHQNLHWCSCSSIWHVAANCYRSSTKQQRRFVD
nr:unnamed protein product [Digitaria exilis]